MSFTPRQYGHFKDDDLEDVEQEMFGKMVRTLRIKHAEEQVPHPLHVHTPKISSTGLGGRMFLMYMLLST